MSERIVSKYGGSSIRTGEDIEQIGRITDADPKRKIIIVSAPGRIGNEPKVTELLSHLVDNPEDLRARVEIIDRYKRLGVSPSSNEICLELRKRLDYNGPNRKDQILAFGEEMCGRMVAKKLGYDFLDPRKIFYVTGDEETQICGRSEKLITKALTYLSWPTVIPGYFGRTPEGQTRVFGRNGSDLTGAHIAAVLGADFEKFTDTQGVYCPMGETISQMTYTGVRNLNRSGNFLFEGAIDVLEKSGVFMHIRSFGDFPNLGTTIGRK